MATKRSWSKKVFEWFATWSVIMRDPSVFGFAKKPTLPPLNIKQITIESGVNDGYCQPLPNHLASAMQRGAIRLKHAAKLLLTLQIA